MELDKGGSNSTKDDSDIDDVTVPDVEMKDSSSHPSSHPQDDDATMVDSQSREQSREPSLPPPAQDDDVPMVRVESRERSSEPLRVDEGNSTVGVVPNDLSEPLSDLSDLEEGGDEHTAVLGVNPTRPTDDEMEEDDFVAAVESAERLSDEKGPESSDSEEDDEEGVPTHAVEKSPDTAVGIEKAAPKTGRKSNDISLNESSVHTAAQFEPRRSSRNVSKKANYAQYVPPQRPFHSKKKPASEKEDVNLLQASHPILPFKNLLIFFFRLTPMMKG
jgi:hypothetical protein